MKDLNLNTERWQTYAKAVANIASRRDNRNIFHCERYESAIIILLNILKFSNKEVIVYNENFSRKLLDESGFFVELKSFVERGGKIKITFNSSVRLPDSRYYKELCELNKMYPNKVFVKWTSKEMKDVINTDAAGITNFMIGDKSLYRVEHIESGKTIAICAFPTRGKLSKFLYKRYQDHFDKCDNVLSFQSEIKKQGWWDKIQSWWN